jgi:excinuclease ABC subunit C
MDAKDDKGADGVIAHSVEELRESLARMSNDPGVYIMRDASGDVLYVGKARNLKKRVASYFKAAGPTDPKTAVLVRKIGRIETIVTASEKEALILESNLIKHHRPRYNVNLKDDKRYPCLRLDLSHPYPRLSIVRRFRKDGAMYFGPYASAYAVRQTLKVINKTFMLRKCTEREFQTRTRPCLHCQMQGCLAPCCRDVDRQTYEEMVREVVLFLKGRTPDLVRKIRQEMLEAAEAEEYEQAARLRDRMFALERTLEKQVAVSTDLVDRDVVVTARGESLSLVTLLMVRGGFLQGSRHFPFEETVAGDEEVIAAFIRQYYEKAPLIPREILVGISLEDAGLLEEWLQGLKEGPVRIRYPRRGEKARLVQMGLQNAAKELQERIAAGSRAADTLMRLEKRLRLSRFPQRIECFDNSNLAGKQPVSSMVVFHGGEPDKASYRLFRVQRGDQPDDYATMNEILQRRFKKKRSDMPHPDLLMLDGGKGQLNISLAVLRDLGLEAQFDVIGIAKKDAEKGESQDKIYKPGQANPVPFGKDADLLLFLQRIRDEAHRFAIAFHRKRRGREAVHSAMDDIPGVGRKRKERLLRHFDSVDQIRSAPVEEIAAVPGIHRALAEAIKDYLNARNELKAQS